jgi:two-component system chemotaxis response regulator CheB
VKVSSAGEIVRSGTIYISPGDAHLICRRSDSVVQIDHLADYPGSRYSPSVDALLESVAATYGSSALAIILSGMGNDGSLGALSLAGCNGRIIVQDEESSVVWGMPGAIVRAGLADAIMPPAHLTRFLARLGRT